MLFDSETPHLADTVDAVDVFLGRWLDRNVQIQLEWK